ncbi:MAG: sulfotransferase [Nocardioidaceae bacterium]
MNTDTPAAVKVVFIAGTGRSGSTVLSSILGQVPGCFAAGEVRYVWERGLLEDHRCGCGEPFSRCPVWKAVMEEAFRGRPAPDAAATASRLDSRLRVRRVPGMVWRRMHGRPALKPHPDDLIIMRLYEALAAREGVQMVVDSSKLPPYGMLLSSLPGLELYIVHIARDPRATAFSWRRKKTTQDTAAGSTMPRLETWRSAILWLLWNLLIDAWWPRSSPRRLLVRYEDLIRDPTTAVGRVLHMIGAELPRT